MKVLTVYQPWADLIAIEAKPFEFRGGKPPKAYIGQRIAVQAAARAVNLSEVRLLRQQLRTKPWASCLRDEIAMPYLDKVLRGELEPILRHILCTAILGEPRNGFDVAREMGMPEIYLPNDSDRDQHANCAWPLSEVRQVIPPFPFRGKQGWGEVSADLLEAGL